MRKKVLEQEFIRLNADYKALLDETIQLREKVATADEALEKMRATEENVRSIHENTRRLKHDMRNHLMVIAMSLGNEKYDEARTYTAQILDKLNLEYSYIFLVGLFFNPVHPTKQVQCILYRQIPQELRALSKDCTHM